MPGASDGHELDAEINLISQQAWNAGISPLHLELYLADVVEQSLRDETAQRDIKAGHGPLVVCKVPRRITGAGPNDKCFAIEHVVETTLPARLLRRRSRRECLRGHCSDPGRRGQT